MEQVAEEYSLNLCFFSADELKELPDCFTFSESDFVLKETGELIGSGGLVYHPENDTWNMGYNIRRDMWGNGYVVEAMQAIMDEIRKTRNIRAIEAQFAVENHKSQRVMEKLGMVYDRESSYEKFDKSAKFQSKTFRREFE